jgi:hypothetical protein
VGLPDVVHDACRGHAKTLQNISMFESICALCFRVISIFLDFTHCRTTVRFTPKRRNQRSRRLHNLNTRERMAMFKLTSYQHFQRTCWLRDSKSVLFNKNICGWFRRKLCFCLESGAIGSPSSLEWKRMFGSSIAQHQLFGDTPINTLSLQELVVPCCCRCCDNNSELQHDRII